MQLTLLIELPQLGGCFILQQDVELVREKQGMPLLLRNEMSYSISLPAYKLKRFSVILGLWKQVWLVFGA